MLCGAMLCSMKGRACARCGCSPMWPVVLHSSVIHDYKEH